jgi:hypothetical protein
VISKRSTRKTETCITLHVLHPDCHAIKLAELAVGSDTLVAYGVADNLTAKRSWNNCMYSWLLNDMVDFVQPWCVSRVGLMPCRPTSVHPGNINIEGI